jgi:hypothetical protein
VDEIVNDDELVKDVNGICWKEISTKNMEGDEFTSNIFSKEKFSPPQNGGLNEPQQDGQREKLRKQHNKWPHDWLINTK